MTQLRPIPLTTTAMIHRFERHASLPLRTDILWLIHRGAVKTLTWNEEGCPVTLGYWGTGDVVGQSLSSINPYEIKCLADVEASCVPLSNWTWLNEAVYRHIQQTEELLYLIRIEPMLKRLKTILVWMARKFGRTVPQGQLIDLRLTHQDLAEIVGTTRVTITRLLNQLERQGILRRTAARTIILLKSEISHPSLETRKVNFC